jgi:hypothetical protein
LSYSVDSIDANNNKKTFIGNMSANYSKVVPLTEGVTTKATKINQIKVTKSLLASMKFVTG